MRRASRKRWNRAGLYIMVVVFTAAAMFPLWWMTVSSLKPDSELFNVPPTLIPHTVTLQHYHDLLTLWPFWNWYSNSIRVALIVAITTTALGVLGGYGLSRFRFRGKGSIRILVLFSYLFPGILLVIPLYIMMVKAALYNTHWSLILTYHVYTLPFSLYFLASFFDGLPRELEEQAAVDGATRLGTFIKVMLPLSSPGVAAAAIYAFIVSYSEFLFATVFINNDQSMTLPAGLGLLALRTDIPWGSTMAAATLVAIPAAILFLIIQPYFVKGLTAGAIKG